MLPVLQRCPVDRLRVYVSEITPARYLVARSASKRYPVAIAVVSITSAACRALRRQPATPKPVAQPVHRPVVSRVADPVRVGRVRRSAALARYALAIVPHVLIVRRASKPPAQQSLQHSSLLCLRTRWSSRPSACGVRRLTASVIVLMPLHRIRPDELYSFQSAKIRICSFRQFQLSLLPAVSVTHGKSLF